MSNILKPPTSDYGHVSSPIQRVQLPAGPNSVEHFSLGEHGHPKRALWTVISLHRGGWLFQFKHRVIYPQILWLYKLDLAPQMIIH